MIDTDWTQNRHDYSMIITKTIDKWHSCGLVHAYGGTISITGMTIDRRNAYTYIITLTDEPMPDRCKDNFLAGTHRIETTPGNILLHRYHSWKPYKAKKCTYAEKKTKYYLVCTHQTGRHSYLRGLRCRWHYFQLRRRRRIEYDTTTTVNKQHDKR